MLAVYVMHGNDGMGEEGIVSVYLEISAPLVDGREFEDKNGNTGTSHERPSTWKYLYLEKVHEMIDDCLEDGRAGLNST
jgi:hypothetical protein